MDAYRKEIRFYSEIAPKINEKLTELNEREMVPLALATCESQNILILEDLSVKGYRTVPGTNGYNFAEAKAIVKRIAQFHAISAVLNEEQPNIYANFQQGSLKIEFSHFN